MDLEGVGISVFEGVESVCVMEEYIVVVAGKDLVIFV